MKIETISVAREGTRDASASVDAAIVYTPWLTSVTIWKLMKNAALARGPCALMIRIGRTSKRPPRIRSRMPCQTRRKCPGAASIGESGMPGAGTVVRFGSIKVGPEMHDSVNA